MPQRFLIRNPHVICISLHSYSYYTFENTIINIMSGDVINGWPYGPWKKISALPKINYIFSSCFQVTKNFQNGFRENYFYSQVRGFPEL